MRLVQLSYSKKECKSKSMKKKKTKILSKKVQNIGGREESLSLFHSLGKVLYAKKEMEAEECIERSDLDCIMFNDLLFENFGDFFVFNQHFLSNKQRSAVQTVQFDEFGFEIMPNNNNK